MILYLDAQTPVCDIVIDFIQITLQSGESVSLNWDTSEIYRSERGFHAKYSGVYFDDEYANGKLEQLRNVVITDVALYTETKQFPCVFIQSMEFRDGEDSLLFAPPVIA